MKKLSKLKLNEISKRNLSQKEMRHVKGGAEGTCACSCYYANSGGSGTIDNCVANQHALGLYSQVGELKCWGGYSVELVYG